MSSSSSLLFNRRRPIDRDRLDHRSRRHRHFQDHSQARRILDSLSSTFDTSRNKFFVSSRLVSTIDESLPDAERVESVDSFAFASKVEKKT